jgi:hypothetical protein
MVQLHAVGLPPRKSALFEQQIADGSYAVAELLSDSSRHLWEGSGCALADIICIFGSLVQFIESLVETVSWPENVADECPLRIGILRVHSGRVAGQVGDSSIEGVLYLRS